MTEWLERPKPEIIKYKNVCTECGFSSNVRFTNPENVSMIDSAGNIMYCKCGKKATTAIFGNEAFISRCSDCMYGSNS